MTEKNSPKKIAVVGSGVAGLTAAYLLSRRHRVTLFEKNERLGGHTHTVRIPSGPDAGTPVDTGFIVYNDRNYPTFIKLLSHLGIEGQPSDMSFGFCSDWNHVEYSSYVPHGLFAQKRNLLRPSFLRMIADILYFNKKASADLAAGSLEGETLESYLKRYTFSQTFKQHYLIPMGAAIWSTSPREMKDFPAEMFVRFFLNHGLLDLGGRPKWRTLPGGSCTYIQKMMGRLQSACRISDPVQSIRREEGAVFLKTGKSIEEKFEACVIATHADEALKLLADPSSLEQELLGRWTYTRNQAVLHTEASLMPQRRKAWASWNYRQEGCPEEAEGNVTLTYWMNLLQSLQTRESYFVTLNPAREIPESKIVKTIEYTHPRFTIQSLETQKRLAKLNDVRATYYCGSYFHYGFHEDAVKSAVAVASFFGESL